MSKADTFNTVFHLPMDLHALIDLTSAYDLWANTLFVRRLDREPDELLDRATPSSFPSLRKTILHVRDADAAWLNRLLGLPQQWPAEDDITIGNLLTHSSRMRDHVAGMKPAAMEKIHAYQDLRGNTHQQPAWQMLQHCFNHSTYHRGQLITMMHALGMEEVPHSDMVIYHRSLKKEQ